MQSANVLFGDMIDIAGVDLGDKFSPFRESFFENY